jgi:hypothetical protein
MQSKAPEYFDLGTKLGEVRQYSLHLQRALKLLHIYSDPNRHIFYMSLLTC